MPLEAPKLDTRTFDEIYQEVLLRIPRYLPEWTDYNESDPGIALVQLFAWLTEMTHYKLNQVPERNYIKFLQLLNMELRPAKAAVAHLTFTAQADFTGVPVVPQFSRVEGKAQDDESLIFETEEGLDLIRPPLKKIEVWDGNSFEDKTAENNAGDTTFRPLGWIPQEGNALYLGFEQADPELLAPIFPQQMRFRLFWREKQSSSPAQNCEESRTPPQPPVKLVWEYRPKADPTRWRSLNVYLDETAAFTSEGYILVAGPRDISATKEGKDGTLCYWLRCRIAKGSYPGGQEPEIDLFRPNVVAARNLATIRDELIATAAGEFESNGRPDQVFVLRNRPVLAKSLSLEVIVPDQPPKWTEVEDFLSSQKNDQHYTFNANKGEIRFGDGQHGQIPPAGTEIVARFYRYGGGKRGNVPPDNIKDLVSPPPGVESVINERRAVGGYDEQSVEEFKERAPFELRSRRRAITEEDFTALALQAGGIATATAIALRHPDFPEEVKVPGAVTVVIVPDTLDKPPIPSSEQIRAVCQQLNNFRLLTTEVYVKGPEYKAIRIEATVKVNRYAAFDKVSQGVVKRINNYLNPLRRNRPNTQVTSAPATGTSVSAAQPLDIWPEWKPGDDFHPHNLYAVINPVEDVVAVQIHTLFVDDIPQETVGDVIKMPKDGLVYGVEDHIITVVPYEDQ